MKKNIYTIKSYLLILLFFISTSSTAEVILHLPDDVSLLAINGSNTGEHDTLPKSTKRLSLPNGKNQIVVRYNAEIDMAHEDSVYEATEAFVILFTSVDQIVTLKQPDIKSVKQFKRFNRNPQWEIVDTKGQEVAFKTEALIKEGVQFGRNYAQELMVYNQSAGIATYPTLAGSSSHQASISVVDTTLQKVSQEKVGSISTVSYENLIRIYQQADPSVQRKFRIWLAQ